MIGAPVLWLVQGHTSLAFLEVGHVFVVALRLFFNRMSRQIACCLLLHVQGCDVLLTRVAAYSEVLNDDQLILLLWLLINNMVLIALEVSRVCNLSHAVHVCCIVLLEWKVDQLRRFFSLEHLLLKHVFRCSLHSLDRRRLAVFILILLLSPHPLVRKFLKLRDWQSERRSFNVDDHAFLDVKEGRLVVAFASWVVFFYLQVLQLLSLLGGKPSIAKHFLPRLHINLLLQLDLLPQLIELPLRFLKVESHFTLPPLLALLDQLLLQKDLYLFIHLLGAHFFDRR